MTSLNDKIEMSKMMKPPTCILFDLDGTLLDSSNGIFDAVEHALISHDFSIQYQRKNLLSYVGLGVAFLLKKIGGNQVESQLASLKKTAFSYYHKHAVDSTHPFSGANKLFKYLQKNNIQWGVVTSKTRVLTESVLPILPCYEQAGVIVCADDFPYQKPHPMPLLKAMESLNVLAEKTAYVGDAFIDMKAAKEAGCYRIFANYGYELDNLDVVDYDLKIDNLEQLIKWIICMNA